MLGRVGRGRSRRRGRRTTRQRDAAAAAELLAGLVRAATRGADRREHRAAFGTVPALCAIVVITGLASHRVISRAVTITMEPNARRSTNSWKRTLCRKWESGPTFAWRPRGSSVTARR